jgi:hypothetical protein
VVGRAAFFLGGNVTGIDREFSLVVMQTCMGERDRARVLGWACVGEIRGKKREMRLVKKINSKQSIGQDLKTRGYLEIFDRR